MALLGRLTTVPDSPRSFHFLARITHYGAEMTWRFLGLFADERKAPTVSSHINAFGVLLFEMLTGRTLVAGQERAFTVRKRQ